MILKGTIASLTLVCHYAEKNELLDKQAKKKTLNFLECWKFLVAKAAQHWIPRLSKKRSGLRALMHDWIRATLR